MKIGGLTKENLIQIRKKGGLKNLSDKELNRLYVRAKVHYEVENKVVRTIDRKINYHNETRENKAELVSDYLISEAFRKIRELEKKYKVRLW
jgi:hypothetical protein